MRVRVFIGDSTRSRTLKTIRQMVEADPAVEAAGRPLTMYLGPEKVLLALDILFRRTLLANEVASAIDRNREVGAHEISQNTP